MKKIAFNLLKIIVSAGLIIYILFFQVNISEVWAVMASANLGPLLVGAAVMIGGVILRSVRWQVLLQALEINVPLPRLVYFYFLGSFFNLFLPTGMGGDAVKMAKLAQETGQVPESIGVTLVERATGLWVLFILALLALPFSSSYMPPDWMPLITAITVGGVIGGFVVMWTPLVPWLGSKIRLPGQASLERFYRSISQLGWRALGLASLISLAFDLLLIWLVQLIAVSLGINLPWSVFFLFTPIISFSLTLPISIGGLGVREQTYILLFQTVNVSAEAATAMSLLYYLLNAVLIGLIGGVLYMIDSVRSARTAGNRI
jgi:uncharacterized membrane protein YbhN (UPF0104 family)